MPAFTAIEIGSDTCALARTSVQRDGDLRVFAAEVLDPAHFPGPDGFTLALRQSRRKLRLPRRCRVVVWGLREGASRHDAAVVPILRPLTDAGFRVERVVSPCNALAALARLKDPQGDGATCWLAVNRGGVAIVVVRPGRQLYAHSFVWDWTLGATGSQARLLQRYSLVSALAPQVRRAMAAAIEKDTRVDAIVTCGNLPDLRSLTMPLIEELDVEVETLDSLEGLDVAPDVADRLADVAQAIRLACAGASARGTRLLDEGERRPRHVGRWLTIAAVIVAICAIGYAWYAKWSSPHAAITTTARPVSQARAGAKTPDTNESAAPAVSTPSVPADKAEASRPRPMPALLKEPAPRITAILVTNGRRYATVERGHIVGVGQMVGRRLVVAIDEQTVLFKEPSGVLIRVGPGGRIVGMERPIR